MKFAEVAVDLPQVHHGTFSYSIPPTLAIAPGQGVWVPFGAQFRPGLVFSLTDTPAVAETRDIARALSSEPLLTSVQLELAQWLASHYRSTLYEAASLMLPPGYPGRAVAVLRSGSSTGEESLSGHQRQVWEMVKARGEVEEREVAAGTGYSPHRPAPPRPPGAGLSHHRRA